MSTARPPRGRRGTVAVVVALIGLLVAAAGAFEAFYLAVKGATWGYESSQVGDFLTRTTLGSTTVLVVGIVVGVVGLLLLLAAIVPPKRRLVELGGDPDGVATGIRPRSVQRTVAAAAGTVDGVSRTSANVGGRSVTVRATTTLRHTDGLADRAKAAAEARLADLAPRKVTRVKVRLERKES